MYFVVEKINIYRNIKYLHFIELWFLYYIRKNSCLSILKTISWLEKLINRAMQVKNDLRNNDLESFKNIVNSTNDTHNKLISSIQKNVDQMIRLVKRSLRTRWWSELHRDKSGQEGVTTALEEKISKISALRWELELWDCGGVRTKCQPKVGILSGLFIVVGILSVPIFGWHFVRTISTCFGILSEPWKMSSFDWVWVRLCTVSRFPPILIFLKKPI